MNMNILEQQEQFTKEIKTAIQAKELNNEEVIGTNQHRHICTFEITSNDRWEKSVLCQNWRAKHPIKFPNVPFYQEDFSPSLPDYCDFCPMMNFVALDEEGKIMYSVRNFPEDIIHAMEKKNGN